jgi:iron-sulfur cluster repair protein YtfE (RIC family)
MKSIGKKGKDPDRSVRGRLLDCHARIREMLELASRLASPPRAPDDEIAATAARVARYFTRGLPMHVRDEEDSLLPRLAPFDDSGALERMRAEHRDHDPLVDALVALAGSLADAPATWDVLCEELLGITSALAREMLPHLDAEERAVLPLLAKLDEAAEAAIAEEMEARREKGR